MKKAIDGEAAYCLTNIEAAICFLETVDLATLKVEGSEGTEEDDKSNKPQIPTAISEPVTVVDSISATPPQPASADETSKRANSRGRRPIRELSLHGTRNRSDSDLVPFTPAEDPLSNLSSKLLSAKIDHSLRVAEEAWENENARTPSPRASKFSESALQPPPKSLLPPASPAGGGAEVVRNRALSYVTKNPVFDVAESVVMGADVGLKTIGDALGGSYKFLFGRMHEKKQEMPKTLEEARKLVEQPATPGVIAPVEEGTGDIWGANPPLPSPSPPPLPVRPGEKERITQSASPAAAFAAVGTGLSRVVGIGSGVVMRGFARSSSNVSLDKEKDRVLAEKMNIAKAAAAAAATATAPTVMGTVGARVVEGTQPLSPPPPVSDLLSVSVAFFPRNFSCREYVADAVTL